MLSHLCVRNYTLVDTLDIEMHSGLTTLTGETGAGKSLLLDAIGLAIGNKPRGDAIHDANTNAEVSAIFDIRQQGEVQRWLQENDLPCDGEECLLKRIITPQGRSRCFIDGHSVSLSQLQKIGEKLVNIHGQHEHQALLNSTTQRRLLDTYGNYPELLEPVARCFRQWQQLQRQLEEAEKQASAQSAQHQLLKYQLEELHLLGLQPEEVINLESQQKRIANTASVQQACSAVINMGRESEHNIEGQLRWTIAQLEPLIKSDTAIKDAIEMLNTALINSQEALDFMTQYAQRYDAQEHNLAEIEQRLTAIYTVARKHKVQPNNLYEHHQKLLAEFDMLSGNEEQIAALHGARDLAVKEYARCADLLHDARKKAALRLARAINEKLALLNMEHAKLRIELEPTADRGLYGNQLVQFLISTIPGKPAAPLSKVASGGELSRIGLAIQVVTAALQTTPTLIFDEVDAGIGGTTGDTVGQLLRELGESTQVLCVTHLAQVASKAHRHLRIRKTQRNDNIYASIEALSGDAVIAEIARMVGGPIDTETSLANARQMMAIP